MVVKVVWALALLSQVECTPALSAKCTYESNVFSEHESKEQCDALALYANAKALSSEQEQIWACVLVEKRTEGQ